MNKQAEAIDNTAKKGSSCWWVYIVCCEKDNSLYTGITTDLERRMKMHNEGTGARYTRNRGPVTMLYSESAKDRSVASKREYQIKQLSRQQKLAIVDAASTQS